MSSESQPILSGTELGKLVDTMMSIAFSEPEIGRDGHHNFYDTANFDAAHHAWEDKLFAARLALEEYVRRLELIEERLFQRIAMGQEITVEAFSDLSRSTYSRESVK